MDESITCPACNRDFKVKVKLETVFCIYCGNKFRPAKKSVEDVAGVEVEKVEKVERIEVTNCERCGAPISSSEQYYKCTSCAKPFCVSCTGIHIPPEYEKLEAKVFYKYRIRPSTIWNSDAATFTDVMASPICNECYDVEFEKCIKRLNTKIKNWKIDQFREMDMKDIDIQYPARKSEEKLKVVESAQELLKKLGKK
jgi:hypothetical protein